MQNGRKILLFTRSPEAEARAKGLPLSDGSRVFAGFLNGWQQRAHEAQAELLIVAPAGSVLALARLLPEASIRQQQGTSFGDRVEAAFASAFRDGGRSVLMVGGDGPPLELADLNRAFAHLESRGSALVLAPAADGGVTALGFNASAERPLHAITWQSPDVFRQLKAEATRLRLDLLLTSPGYDLDSARNVGVLYRLSRLASNWRAFRWLLLSLLIRTRNVALGRDNRASRLIAHSRNTRGPPLFVSA